MPTQADFKLHRLCLIVCALCVIRIVLAVPIDNAVVGSPTVSCLPGQLSLTMTLKRPLGTVGSVFARGFHNDSRCRGGDTGRSTAAIALSEYDCGVEKLRKLSPKGVFVVASIIVSFHRKFITKVDRVYRVSCFYMEAQKSVSQELEVSMLLPTPVVSQQTQMPACRYEVLDGGPTGQVVRYATVGQQVYHKWTCLNGQPDIYCMVVHSCSVDSGRGVTSQHELVDENGCAKDKYLLGNLEYSGDLMVGREAHVFKYADQLHLHFRCEISINAKEPERPCSIWHPVCPESPGKRKRSVQGETRHGMQRAMGDALRLDVSSQILQVLESGGVTKNSEIWTENGINDTFSRLDNSICRNRRALAAVISYVLVSVSMLILTAGVCRYIQLSCVIRNE